MISTKTITTFWQQLLGKPTTTVTVPSINALTRQTPIKPTPATYRRITSPVYTNKQYMQLAVMLASLLGEGLESFRVLEQFGRVFIIAYLPYGQKDPVLPFIFRDYGQSYQLAYQNLSDMLVNLAPNPESNWQGVWDYRKAQRYASRILQPVTADPELTNDEVEFFRTNLMCALALPKQAAGGTS